MSGMNGRLEDWLQCVVTGKNTNVFEEVGSAPLDDMIVYLKDGIVTQIFTSSSVESITNLQRLANLLQRKFLSQGKIPFTMRRICELIYHPLKYYKINELDKFNHAIEKCINVESEYDFTLIESMDKLMENNHGNLSTDADAKSGDVSMSKIPFLLSGDDELKIRKDYNEFLKEIDSVMSINYEYDEDEDDDYLGEGDGEEGMDEDEEDDDEEDDDDEDDDDEEEEEE